MLQLRCHGSVSAWLLLRLFGHRNRGLSVGRFGLLRLEDLPEPPLPAPDWVRVRPRVAGICGTDLGVLQARGSAYFSGVTSTLFTMGHEVTGEVTEVGPAAAGVSVGERVVIRPALGCTARGIAPACKSGADGQIALCLNVACGSLAPGLQTGFCRDTGGGWSKGLVAHPSQLYRVPEGMDDLTAVLTEPLACAVHAVSRAGPRDDETVLVIGCGTMGLLTVVALRANGFRGRLLVAARHPHQGEHARSLGADEVLPAARTAEDRLRGWAKALGATLHPARLGGPLVLGGAECVIDCVASSQSLDAAARLTAARGRLVSACRGSRGVWTVPRCGPRRSPSGELLLRRLGGRGPAGGRLRQGPPGPRRWFGPETSRPGRTRVPADRLQASTVDGCQSGQDEHDKGRLPNAPELGP